MKSGTVKASVVREGRISEVEYQELVNKAECAEKEAAAIPEPLFIIRFDYLIS